MSAKGRGVSIPSGLMLASALPAFNTHPQVFAIAFGCAAASVASLHG